jgi:predicted HAD superfamily Cof-like phosphohydrolase
VPSPANVVREFHTTFDLARNDVPTWPSAELAELRQRLLVEETAEVGEAVAGDDLAAVAQELADVVYIAYGTALTYGIDLDAVIAEVHRANMSKLDENGRPLYRADGKVAKGPRYQPPDIRAVLGSG